MSDDSDGETDGDVLCVDFDGTLTQDNVAYWEGERPEPDPVVVGRVRQHYRSHNTVIIWTARPWREAGRIAGHLVTWDVPYHGIRCNKGSGDIYVDDKAVTVADWKRKDGEHGAGDT